MNSKSSFYYPIITLVIIFYSVSLIFFNFIGFKTGSDSQRYILYAKDLSYVFDSFKAFSSLSYILLIKKINFLGIHIHFINIIQILIHSIAGFCLYSHLFKNKHHILICILSVIIYLFFPPLFIWNFYLLTDSLNVHLALISIYFLANNNKKYFLLIFLLILFSSFIRAHSIFLLFTFATFIVYESFFLKHKKIFYILTITSIILFIVILNYTSLWIINYISESYISGKFLWGNDNFGINGLEYENNIKNLFDLLKLMISNPFYSLEYFSKKLFYFIYGVRPEYSIKHNLFLYTTMTCMIIATVNEIYFHLIKRENRTKFYNLLLLYSSYNIFASLIIFLDPDSRFVLPIYPFLILCSGMFLNRIYKFTI